MFLQIFLVSLLFRLAGPLEPLPPPACDLAGEGCRYEPRPAPYPAPGPAKRLGW